MFPSSLHKNIRELDKQISLLETECENMEAGKKRTRIHVKPSHSKIMKSANSHLKSPPVKELAKKPYVTGPSRSLTTSSTRQSNGPPLLQKMHSTTSVPYKDGPNNIFAGSDNSPLNQIPGAMDDQVSRAASSHSLNNEKCIRKGRTLQIQSKCECGEEMKEGKCDAAKYHPDGANNLLHREVLYTKPGSTIEVTVKQKSSKTDKCNDLSCKRSINSIKEVSETGSDRRINLLQLGRLNVHGERGSAHKIDNPKWADILFQDEGVANKKTKRKKSKQNEIKCVYECMEFSRPSSCQAKRPQSPDSPTRHSDCYKDHVRRDAVALKEKWLNENQNMRPKTPVSPTLKKSRSPRTKKKCEPNLFITKLEEKEIQCMLWNSEPKKHELPLDLYNPVRTINFLLNELKDKTHDKQSTKLLFDIECNLQKICGDKFEKSYNTAIHPFHKEAEPDQFTEKDNEYVTHLRKNYANAKKINEKLNKEKEKLKEELAAKVSIISSASAREKDYVSTIAKLKKSLEAAKSQLDENMHTVKELTTSHGKLSEEKKVVDALRKSHTKMQERIQKCLMENDKLKTQIRMNKLESQKLSVLLAGKDVEIKRYREEVESFQKQVSEQLAVLRSNAAVNEVEKAMEAIIHHSQVFSQTDLDSGRSESKPEQMMHMANRSSTPNKVREKLTHSSPTSSRTSAANSSWNKISSIYAEEGNGNKNNNNNNNNNLIVLSELHADLKDSEEIFGVQESSSYDGDSSKPSPDSSHYKQRMGDAPNSRNNSSFTSCRSVVDLESGDLSTSRPAAKKSSDDCMATFAANTQRLRENIEELFQDMKFRCTERIYSSPPGNLKYEEMFSISPLSNLSDETYENLSLSESDNPKQS